MSSARYFVERGAFEKGLTTMFYRRKPDEMSRWLEVEVNILPEQPIRVPEGQEYGSD